MAKNVVILVRQNGLGVTAPGDEAFGIDMLGRFLHALEGQPERPSAICFYTEGVKACCVGAPTVPALKLLEGLGTRLVLCRTCLEHYDLLGQVRVGEVGNMAVMAGLLLGADRVITV